MSILSGPAIREAIKKGDIQIDPFDERMINPASIDLTLGDRVLLYDTSILSSPILDPIKPNPTVGFSIDTLQILSEGCGYLMHTVERVGSRKYVPVLDGKSSLGRLFIQVHATAGYGDPGFYGQWTLEVTVTHPVRVYPGMRIAQMRFHEMVGEVQLYDGNYQNEAASGPVASRSWRQFEK